MKIKKEEILPLLNKFKGASLLASSYDQNFPLWSSIIFDAENQRILCLGRRFLLEASYPVEESFIVNFERLRSLLSLSKKEVDVRVYENAISFKTKGEEYKLNQLKIDYTPFLYQEPPPLEKVPINFNLIDVINFCSIAASTSKMEYTKYGVILGNDKTIYAISGNNNAVAAVFLKENFINSTILLRLPWCNILKDLGEITHLETIEEGTSTILFLNITDGKYQYKAVIPSLKVQTNPTLLPYLQSFRAHSRIENLSTKVLKKLDITTDDAYKHVVAFSKDGSIYLETSSKTKGVTKIKICEGELDKNISISLFYLKKVVSFSNFIDIDLDNLVAFFKEKERLYAFSLG